MMDAREAFASRQPDGPRNAVHAGRPLLLADNVVKRYGKFQALSGVSLSVQPNTVHSVIGPNGAGKTTLFHTLTGTVPLTSGAIHLDGRNISHLPDHARVQLGVARSFQVTSLFPSLTVRENLRLAAQGVAPRQAMRFWSGPLGRDAHGDLIGAIAERLGLLRVLDRTSSQLSHGQQRRLEVGLALAARPKVIFLDEPTSGMGIDDIDSMKAIIAGLRSDLTVVLIEHNMGIVMDISDTITVMHLGKVLVEGTPRAVRQDEAVRRAYLGNMMTGGR